MDASILRELALQITGIDTLEGCARGSRLSVIETGSANEKVAGEAGVEAAVPS